MINPKAPTTSEMNELFVQACEDQNNGKLNAAEQKYLQLLEFVPEAPILLYNLGLVYFAKEAFAEAEKNFAKALTYAPQDLDILFNLSLSQKRNGNTDAAIGSYKKLLAMEPESIDVLYNLGGCYKDSGLYDNAIEMYLKVVTHKADHLSAHNNLAYLYQYLGETERAIHHYKKVIEVIPDHAGANHMLSALTGQNQKSTADLYVKEVFDSYSTNYEQSLVNELEYCVPEEIFSLYKELKWQKSTFKHGLDLGCGTGLCGEKFDGEITLLDGVDLSEKMIEIAKGKNIYRNLDVENIVDYLRSSKNTYDFFLAADVFGYMGDLIELFTLIKSKSSSDVLFCFSTETSEDEAYALNPTGRFTHAPDYIISIAAQTGWSIVSSRSSKLRKERGQWVYGMLWFLSLQ